MAIFSSLRSNTTPPPEDQRQQTHQPAEGGETPVSPLDLLSRFLPGFRLGDILSSAFHSDDFKDTRADYIQIRLRFMTLFFALAVPLWIPIDLLTVSAEHFTSLVIARTALTLTLLALGLITFRKQSHQQIHVLLALTLLAPALFYIASIVILQSGVPETPLSGYLFMPFLLVAMMGLFPMTILNSSLLIGVTFIAYLSMELWQGLEISVDSLNKLWLFLMFAGITLWVQSGQLLMLLKLYRESTRDPLTGLINRRVLMKRLQAEMALKNKTQRSFSILMFDLDRFKRVNDTYGHLTGDQVLKTAAKLLENQLRSTDIIARFGGEEFVAVLPGLAGPDATTIAERIRKACNETKVQAPNGDLIQLSTSVGVTEYETDETIENTLTRVDDSLYKAKELGRNRVIYSQSEAKSVQQDPTAG